MSDLFRRAVDVRESLRTFADIRARALSPNATSGGVITSLNFAQVRDQHADALRDLADIVAELVARLEPRP